MNQKYVYLFNEGNGTMRALLGGKGANLAEMTGLGLPVPEGFTVTTEACNLYYQNNGQIALEVTQEVFKTLQELEKKTSRSFGDRNNPLLVSVRSGSRASMPGMMDTILNLGLNDEVVEGMIELTRNPRFVYDCYRRFIQMYADVVMELPKAQFEVIIDEMKEEKQIELDADFTADDFKEMIGRFKNYYTKNLKEDFPQDPRVQLIQAIEAVFRSWNNPRAIYYRRMNEIPNDWGTAVNIQRMVFGNMGDDCATGVAFTRNPANGENHIFGEFLINAQGEDVVAGTRTPLPMEQLKDLMPEAYQEFADHCKLLEHHYKDMQDMEFTIEKSHLYLLQTRSGKRTAKAALKIAVDLVHEKLLTKEEALLLIDPKTLDQVLHPTFDPQQLSEVKAVGSALPASPGAATGRIALSAEKAIERANLGQDVILVRLETSPEDIEGMHLSKGILTARGGMTSHAAVVARGMGRCCVSGCGQIRFIGETQFELNGHLFNEGDSISLDGSTGQIYVGELKTTPVSITGDFETIMEWSDDVRTLGIRTNADTPHDVKQALEFGAEGIGLIRTEHMFFEPERIMAMREMIVSKTLAQREHALAKILPMQRDDFVAIFEVLEGRPVTVRYLDPPLHEFLPTSDKEIRDLAKEMKIDQMDLREAIVSLHEFNPMMGHRGVRLAITYPEIAAMQTRAVIEAAIIVKKEHPEWKVQPEIMIPLVGTPKELVYVKDVVHEVAQKLIEESHLDLTYKVGTMIEIPRACVIADELAKEADFFSFGTNDLTQMTFGFSRDDAAKFLGEYYTKGIYEQDPFEKIDQIGVGRMIEIAVNLGRQTNPKIKMGICGEHGGDPSSIDFCHRQGLDYVSCSPYRVPIARLAAAQSALRHKEG